MAIEPRDPQQSPSPRTSRPPTDTRRQRARDQRALFLAVIAFLLVAGTGLIYLIYGTGAAFAALLCLLAGVAVLILLWAIVSAIEKWADA